MTNHIITVEEVNIAVNFWGFLISIICMLVIIKLSMGSKMKRLLVVTYFAASVTILTYLISVMFDGIRGNGAYMVNYVMTWLNYLTSIELVYLFALLVEYRILHYTNRAMKIGKITIRQIMSAISLFMLAVVVLTPAFDLIFYIGKDNRYQRGPLFALWEVYILLAAVIISFMLNRIWDDVPEKYCRGFIFDLSVMFIGVSIQWWLHGLSTTYISIILMVLHYTMMQIAQESEDRIKREHLINEQSMQLHNAATKIMLSQIHPDFLFSTLNRIDELCDSDSAQAQNAVNMFSDYLRANLNSLKVSGLIPLEEELNHVKTYLNVEKLHINNDVELIMDIPENTIKIPVMTILPIVENIVEYGMKKYPETNLLSIHAKKKNDDFEVILQVDMGGVSVDLLNPFDDGYNEMFGIKQRLELYGAKLEQMNDKSQGLQVVISLPKERFATETEDIAPKNKAIIKVN